MEAFLAVSIGCFAPELRDVEMKGLGFDYWTENIVSSFRLAKFGLEDAVAVPIGFW